jgi:hypothetical protein
MKPQNPVAHGNFLAMRYGAEMMSVSARFLRTGIWLIGPLTG